MIIAITALIAIVAIVYVLGVRAKDLPEPEPVSPFEHLDERKAAIYENLRDLQFEYRLGKLSDADYQSTKQDLQKELAVVLAEVDALKGKLGGKAAAGVQPEPAPKSQGAAKSEPAPAPQSGEQGLVCPSCGATFQQALKFCGECGKPMRP